MAGHFHRTISTQTSCDVDDENVLCVHQTEDANIEVIKQETPEIVAQYFECQGICKNMTTEKQDDLKLNHSPKKEKSA